MDTDERTPGARGGVHEEFPAELGVVAALRRLGESVSADERTRARIGDRIGALERRTEKTPPAGTSSAPRRVPRPLPALTATFAALLSLAALAMVLSGSALPGDSLYPVKRLRETVALGLTFGEEADAHRRLEYAALRLDEMAALTSPTAGRTEGHPRTPAVVLDAFTEQATAATARITALATRSGGQELIALRKWAHSQKQRIRDLGGDLPGPVRTESTALLERIERRTSALADRMHCYRITSGETDELGSLPATGRCDTGPIVGPSRPGGHARGVPRSPAGIVSPDPVPPDRAAGAVSPGERDGPARSERRPCAETPCAGTARDTDTSGGTTGDSADGFSTAVTPPTVVPAPVPHPVGPRRSRPPETAPAPRTLHPVLRRLPEVTIE